MSLAILTPFEGKAWALDRWLSALRGAGLPADTQLVWLCNSDDPTFLERLTAAAASMPYTVTLWQDPTKVKGETAEHAKDATVARLWRELRRKIPEGCGRVLTLEDDVLLSPGTMEALLALADEHGENTVAVAPVPCRVGGQSPDGAWIFRDGRVEHAIRTGRSGRIDCAAFGCTLYPRALFDLLSLMPDPEGRAPRFGYDNMAGLDVSRLGGQMVAGWQIRVEHMEHPAIGAPVQHSPRAGYSPPPESQAQKAIRERARRGDEWRRQR